MQKGTEKEILDVFFARDDAYGQYRPYIPGQKAPAFTVKQGVSAQMIALHLRGEIVIGAHTTSKDNLCKWGCFDFDPAKPAKLAFLQGDASEFKRQLVKCYEQARAVYDQLRDLGIKPVLECSVGGYHVWVLFAAPISAARAHQFMSMIRPDIGCERFPKQKKLGEGKYGNWVRLPGRYHSSDKFSEIYNGDSDSWLSVQNPSAWLYILSANRRTDPTIIEQFVQERERRQRKQRPQVTQVERLAELPGDDDHAFRNAVLDVLRETPGVCDHYDDFIRLVLALKYEGYDYSEVDEIFARSANYDRAKNEKQWDKSQPNGEVTFGTVVKYAQECNPGQFRKKIGALPSTATCRDCGKLISFQGPVGERRPFNLDGSQHRCTANTAPETAPILPALSKAAQNIFQSFLETEHKTLDGAIHEDIRRTINAAMHSPAGACSVEAATGSGKTTCIASELISIIRTGNFCVYVASQKSDMRAFAEILGGMVPGDEKEDIATKIAVFCGDQQDAITDQTRLVITHHGYLLRKGFSTLHYYLQSWIKKNKPLTVIDEFAQFVDKAKIEIALGTRYDTRRTSKSKAKRHELYSKCRGGNDRGNCVGCKLSNNIFIRINKFSVVEIKPHVDGYTGSEYEPLYLDVVTTTREIRINTNMWQRVYCRAFDITKRQMRYEHDVDADREPIEPTAQETLDDIIRCMFSPLLYSTTPIERTQDGDGAPVEPQTIRDALKQDPDAKKNFCFPGTACQVRHLLGWDKSPLVYSVMHSCKVLALNAHLDEEDESILYARQCAVDAGTTFKRFPVKHSGHKLQHVGFFLFLPKLRARQEPLQKIISGFKPDEYFLWYAHNKEQAEAEKGRLYYNFPASIVDADGSRVDNNDIEKRAVQGYYTTPDGPLGQAVTLANGKACFIDAHAPLPAIAISPGEHMTEQAIIDARRRKRSKRIVQPGGRTLRIPKDRADSPKVVTAHNLCPNENSPHYEDIDLAMIGANFADMVEHFDERNVLVVEESEEYLWKAVQGYLETGKLPEQTEKEFLAEKAARKPRRNLSKKQRQTEGYEEARKKAKAQEKKAKEQEKYDREMAKAREMLAGGGWTVAAIMDKRKIYDKFNKRLARKFKRSLEQN
jgi:hypothetical protein